MKEIFDNFRLGRNGGRLNSILEQLILLRESNRLLPALVLAVDVSGNLAEEDDLVLLKAVGEIDSIVVVVGVYRIPQRLVVLLFDEQRVVRLVDGLDVELFTRSAYQSAGKNKSGGTYVLDSDEVRANERDVVELLAREHPDDARVINAGDHDGEQVGDEHGLLLDVERQGLVVAKRNRQYLLLKR